MSIEDEFFTDEMLGEQTMIPQWETVAESWIIERGIDRERYYDLQVERICNQRPQFFEDLETGFI